MTRQHKTRVKSEGWSAFSEEESLTDLILQLEKELGIESQPAIGTRLEVESFRKSCAEVAGDDFKTQLDLAIAFMEMEFFEACRAQIKTVPSHSKEFVSALCLMGECLSKEGNSLKALDFYMAANRLPGLTKSQMIEIQYQLGRLYFELGDHSRSSLSFSYVSKLDPNYRDVKNRLWRMPMKKEHR